MSQFECGSTAEAYASGGTARTARHRSPSVPYEFLRNPFSEAQFKTLKYRPKFPQRSGCIQDARTFCRAFFDWYNNVHYHSGLNWLTPATVHYGLSGPAVQRRNDVLDSACNDYPDRFVNAPRTIAGPPAKVWINPPAKALVGA